MQTEEVVCKYVKSMCQFHCYSSFKTKRGEGTQRESSAEDNSLMAIIEDFTYTKSLQINLLSKGSGGASLLLLLLLRIARSRDCVIVIRSRSIVCGC